MKYRMQLFLLFSLVFLAVLSEAKDKKKSDKKLKAKALDLNVKDQNWPEPEAKVKDWLLDQDHKKFLDKWQKVSDSESKKLGNIKKNGFSTEGLCSKNYKCETITFGSSAAIDKDAKNPAKALKPLTLKKMDKFLEHLKKRKPIKLTHQIQKGTLVAAEVHHNGVVARFTERNGKEVNGEHAAALAFDAYKYIALYEEPMAVRALLAATDGKDSPTRAVCLFPKGANRAQADNFCRGKDAEADEDDEKSSKKDSKKDKKKGTKQKSKDTAKKEKDDKEDDEPKGSIWDMLKKLLGFKPKDKSTDKKSEKSKSKEDKEEKGDKEKKDKSVKKVETKGKKTDEEKEDKKDDKEDVSLDGEDKGKDRKDDKKEKSKDASEKTGDKSEADAEDVDLVEDSKDDAAASKKGKDANKDKSATKKTDSKTPNNKKADKEDEDDIEMTGDDKEKKPSKAIKKKIEAFKQDVVQKKINQQKASIKTAVKKQTVLKAAKDDLDNLMDNVDELDETANKQKKKPGQRKGANKKGDKKKPAIKKGADKDFEDEDGSDLKPEGKGYWSETGDHKVWARSADPEPAYFGGASNDALYGRSAGVQYGDYSDNLYALRRRRQEILKRAMLARRQQQFDDEALVARSRMVREPVVRREAEPAPEPEPEPQPEPEPEAEPAAEAEADAEADIEQPQGSYLLSRSFFQDVETLIARQSPDFHDRAQMLLERELGFDDCEECFDW